MANPAFPPPDIPLDDADCGAAVWLAIAAEELVGSMDRGVDEEAETGEDVATAAGVFVVEVSAFLSLLVAEFLAAFVAAGVDVG